MPLIDMVGRKSPKVMVLFAVMYAILILGGITMVYPFAIMLSNSITDDVDFKEFNLIPRYTHNDDMLFRKFLALKYATPSANLPFVNERFGERVDVSLTNKAMAAKNDKVLPIEFKEIPKADLTGLNGNKMYEDWEAFVSALPLNYKVCAFKGTGSMTGPVENKFRQWVQKKYGTIQAVNAAYTSEYLDLSSVRSPVERLWDRVYTLEDSPIQRDFTEFKKGLNPDETFFINCDGPWQTFLRVKYNKKSTDAENLAELNAKNKTSVTEFNNIVLAPTLQESGAFKEEWKEFAKTKYPLRYMLISRKADPLFSEFLREKYKTVKIMSEVWSEKIASFDSFKASGDILNSNQRQYFQCLAEFVAKKLPAEYITLNSTENLYRAWLKNKYGSAAKVNEAYGTKITSFDSARVPYQVFDTVEFSAKKSQLRWYFIQRNYNEVFGYVLLHGRAVLNTIVYVLAVILVTLTINPMCAYALSRFKLSYGNKVLLFLLATMAFPAEVGLIPNFLLLKNLHLLNTYWALILPGLANGFSIFILKGFFDSLPKEFYEAAEMDGAGELNIFFNITLPLAQPVLAYLTIGAFVGAYGAFMFAMLVCQDPNMWTIMVWLYQMWEWAPAHVRMAAYVVASIPTLLIFIFAQRIIMRGIIIPVQH